VTKRPRPNGFERSWRTITVTLEQERILAQYGSRFGSSSTDSFPIYLTSRLQGLGDRGREP